MQKKSVVGCVFRLKINFEEVQLGPKKETHAIFSSFYDIKCHISNSNFRHFDALRRRPDIAHEIPIELTLHLVPCTSGGKMRVPRYKATKLENFPQFVRDLAAFSRKFFPHFFLRREML